jgi:drug/metabolite transporter (DMT)-like permease
MNDFYVGTISLLVSNVLLSSYPILIKSYITNISIVVQLIVRIVVYICLALPFLVIGGEGMNILTTLIEPKYLAISAVNMLHIYSSYKGFEYLNAGVSLTTFYSYPIIQVLLARIFLGTELTSGLMYNLFGSLLGIGILNKDTLLGGEKSINVKKGFSFIAIAAITEAIIGVFYKGVNIQNPFMSLYSLYAPAFVFFIIWYLYQKYRESQEVKNKVIGANWTDEKIQNEKDDKKDNWWHILTNHGGFMKRIILYNILIGGIGYTLRLFSLTKIPISWFSGLSFTSSLSAFMLGWFFLGERIKLNHLLGSIVIFYNLFKINNAHF